MTQLSLPMGVVLEPTPAMRSGVAYVVQCSWCGTLLCVPWAVTGDPQPGGVGAHLLVQNLGRCPACDPPSTHQQGWWGQELPVGPFELEEVAS